jgi:hypothetical protein
VDIKVAGLFIGALLAVLAGFVWVAIELRAGGGKKADSAADGYSNAAERDVEHIFNDTFREELRNRGRLHFEKIIGENAMFLQQDLRLTTSQLNEFMKTEITRTLKDEFSKYEQSIADAKQLAIDSIGKTQEAIEDQRKALGEQMQKQFGAMQEQMVARFEEHMADIVNHYLMTAIGDQIDLNDQLDYIIAELDANKKAIVEDITNGA